MADPVGIKWNAYWRPPGQLGRFCIFQPWLDPNELRASLLMRQANTSDRRARGGQTSLRLRKRHARSDA